jgi:transcriptional regulator with XRE-family HTH domain
MPHQPTAAEKLENMIAALQNRGMSFRDIGREAGISSTTVFRLSAGEGRAPSYETFTKLEVLYYQRTGSGK